MKIENLRITNYKGFRDSGEINFGRGFNVIVGQNNSGKTALLETLRFNATPPRPYRGLSTDTRNLDPNSVATANFFVSGAELKAVVVRHGAGQIIPVKSEDIQAQLDDLFSASSRPIQYISRMGVQSVPGAYPSHGMFKGNSGNIVTTLILSEDRQNILHSGLQSSVADQFTGLLDRIVIEHVYVFRPERLNIGTSKAEDTDVLKPDAQNLPAVLLKLQGNLRKFERFNDHVREIFPSIFNVVIVPTTNNNVNIRIWTVDPTSERDDLCISLEECGTGVGQVLAILYVAMTRTENVIAIDEPNSFLHPGAAKKLIRILKQYDRNQYIISTHSPELISVAEPDTIHSIRWNGEESVVEEFDRASIDDMQRLLNDIGVSLSDVFGADRIVWVEGPTECACFPKISALLDHRPVGVSFVSLRSPGDLETKSDATAIIQIYENLTAGASLVPPTLSFNLDREDRSDSLIADIERRTQGRVRFLPRLTYENYILDADAISAVLIAEAKKYDSELRVMPDQVRSWLSEHGGKYSNGAVWSNDFTSREWLERCQAPNLLKALFNDLTDAAFIFRKTTHSVALTSWLIENKPEALSELRDYLGSLTEEMR